MASQLLIDGKTPEQDRLDREWGEDIKKRALRLWHELTGSGIVETEPRYAHVDGLAVPLQPSDHPYFLEVQARRCLVGDYETLMFSKTQYERMLDYHRELGFPTVLLAVWRDGLGHLLIPSLRGNPVVGERLVHGQAKVLLDINKFDFVRPDRFARYFPAELFGPL